MSRKLLTLLGVFVLVPMLAEPLWAQDWPDAGTFSRGPGNYLAWWKILLCWVVFACWVRTTDWINFDVQEIGESVEMSHTVWNPVVVFTFLAGFILCISLPVPIFAVGYIILVAAYVGPLMTYILQRNGRVTDDQKVLTPSHIKAWFGNLGKGKKQTVEVKQPWEAGPALDIAAQGGLDDAENQSNLIAARQSPGFITVKEVLADALDKNADRLMLDFTRDAVGARLEVDGIWHNLPPRDRESSDIMLAVMKKIANLDMNERRKRQEGTFGTNYRGSKLTAKFASQGTKTGERVIISFEGRVDRFTTLDSLGMREKMRDEFKAMMANDNGLVVVSAMPGGGLTTTWTVALKSTDRYLRDFVGVYDASKPKPYVENIDLQTYDSTKGQTPDGLLPALILKQPDAYAVPELHNGKTLELLCQQSNEDNKFVVSSVRAKEAVEALLRLLLLKPPAEPLSKALVGVLNQRLVRRLCDACKQPYEPSQQLLQKLGIPAGRIRALYRAYQPQPGQQPQAKGEPEVCAACGGIGFRGRIAIFELVTIDDEMRQALVSQPRIEVLRSLARKSGSRSLQEEGIVLVAQGITSINELQRVLKQ